jgi:ABC-2 type transport system ATP-binding protein
MIDKMRVRHAPVPPAEAAQQRPQSMDAAISTEGLTKKFSGEIVVQNVTFQVPRGSIFGFIGPSGSGKTTTVRMLTGVYAPTSGQVRVLGSDPRKFDQKTRGRIGYMPQLFVLYPQLSIWENLNFVASLYGMGLFRGTKLRQTLEFVELVDQRDKLAREASGGMQRRLSLAASLVHDPELLFLDEPTAGIDPVLRRKFWEHFRELQSQGRTLFITTQYVNEAAFCDLVGVMAEGKLVAVDTPVGLRHRAYGGDMVDLITASPLDYGYDRLIRELAFVHGDVVRRGPSSIRITVEEASTAIPKLMDWSRAQNLQVKSIEEYSPPFEDVFVELVKPEVVYA